MNQDVNCIATFTNTNPLTAAVDINAEPTSVASGGESTLTWSYERATSCTITPPASLITVYPDGGGTVGTGNLTISRTYTIICNPGSVSDSADVTVQGQSTYDLNVIKSGQGTVTSTSVPTQVNQINCGSGCQTQTVSFTSDASVSLQAVIAPGRIFTGWGGHCSGAGACSVLLNSPKTVTANFAVDPSFKEF